MPKTYGQCGTIPPTTFRPIPTGKPGTKYPPKPQFTSTQAVAFNTPPANREPERDCPACGERLIRRENEPLNRWKNRQFCDLHCSTRHITTWVSNRPCEICGETITRHPNETRRDFKNRETCSEKCRRILTGRNVSAAAKKRAPKIKPPCNQPDCERPRHASNGMCKNHYNIWARRMKREQDAA